jgi:hypothetical protein
MQVPIFCLADGMLNMAQLQLISLLNFGEELTPLSMKITGAQGRGR